MSEDGINPDDWDFSELVERTDVDAHAAYYSALDQMDEELLVLSQNHQDAMEGLVADFYTKMQVIMDKYKLAIDADIKFHTPWLMNPFKEEEDNDNN